MRIDANKIEEHLCVLQNQRIKTIGRAGNMLWLGFGNDVETTNFKSEKRIVCRYALDVQCVWRLVSSEGIVVGYRDFYHPSQRMVSVVKLSITIMMEKLIEVLPQTDGNRLAAALHVLLKTESAIGSARG